MKRPMDSNNHQKEETIINECVNVDLEELTIDSDESEFEDAIFKCHQLLTWQGLPKRQRLDVEVYKHKTLTLYQAKRKPTDLLRIEQMLISIQTEVISLNRKVEELDRKVDGLDRKITGISR